MSRRSLPRIGPADLRDHADDARVERVWQRLDAELTVPEAGRARRRAGLALALAATLAAFVGGYSFGHSKGKPSAFTSIRTVAMHGPSGGASHGVINIAEKDSVGNWPMLLEVSGLPQQAKPSSYYELWLTHNGKAVAPCGSFRVNANTTRVRLSVPYALKNFDGWVVTTQDPDRNGLGSVVLTT